MNIRSSRTTVDLTFLLADHERKWLEAAISEDTRAMSRFYRTTNGIKAELNKRGPRVMEQSSRLATFL